MHQLFKVLSFLPLVVLHGMGWLLGWAVFLASGTYRQRLISNAKQAGLSRRDWVGSIGAAGQLIAELPRLWMGAPVPVQWSDQDKVRAALDKGQGVLFLTPHLGSFEVAAQAYAAQFGQYDHPITVLFRPPRQAWLRPLVASSRDRPGLKTGPTNLAGVKQMVRALKSGECVGMLPDQVPPEGLGEWVTFFGKDAYTMTLSARLVAQTGATVVFLWGERLPWGRGYLVRAQALPEPLSPHLPAALRQLNAMMESIILQTPRQYLWSYARYKTPRNTSL
jgi:Kdo2-lipid IVA lauroyltransferase/acyltransferase